MTEEEAKQAIQYSSPINSAFLGMQAALFKPFSLEKWLVLGFTAWLAGLFESGGSFNMNFSDPADPELREQFGPVFEWVQANIELVITIGVLVLLISTVVYIALLWVSSRGKFMFLDNVIFNRAQVTTPWRQFSDQGNSLFWWRLLAGFLLFLLVLPVIAGFGWFFYHNAVNETLDKAEVLIPLILGALAVILVFAVVTSYIYMLLEDFVIPIMYRDGLTAWQAWGKFMALHNSSLGTFLLYALLKFMLWFAVSIALTVLILIVTVVTCCIGLLLFIVPYVSTVVILPILVFFRYLGPLFLRQFGTDFDPFTLPPEHPGNDQPAAAEPESA